ncbi:MAG: DMT family transporter [Chloroflexota bacterium]|nr:DMT family transporter [Chloroflexota bacterium]
MKSRELSPGPQRAAGGAARVRGHSYRWAVLGLGVVAVSTGSILIRLTQAPPLVVGTWRLLLAALLLTPWALPSGWREWRQLGRDDLGRLVLVGVALAAHFATWVSSLSYTTVASSVVLVSTNPIFVGLAGHFLLGERLSRRTVLAVAISMLGTIIVSYGDWAFTGQALWGDVLALMGAMGASAYMLLGRAVRRKVSTIAYVWPCYGIAGAILLLLCVFRSHPLLGYDLRTFSCFLLLAVVPQIVGHSSFNWALAHFSPMFITLALLGEPVGATLLAFLVLGEVPPLSTLAGGVCILVGIYFASQEERHP